MKIVALSDLHGYLPEVETCDVVCICGDIMPLNIQRNIFASIAWLAGPFQEWALSLPCNKVIMTWGNHDFIGERLYKYGDYINTDPSWSHGYDGDMQNEILFQTNSGLDNRKIVILIDETYKYNGVNFYGTPWCPALNNWAFYGTAEELKEKFNKIPENTDVLITHCPPKFGQQGIVLQQGWNYLKNFGSQELQDAIVNKFPNRDNKVYVLSGHIHSGNHEIETLDNINYVNVSIKDEHYKDIYKAKIINI